MLRRSIWLVLLVACSSRKLPEPPAGSGLAVRAEGDWVVVTDEIGKAEIRFPGTPTLSMETTSLPTWGPRQVVTGAQSREHGALLFMAYRLKDGDLPSPEQIKVAYAGVRTALDHASDF